MVFEQFGPKPDFDTEIEIHINLYLAVTDDIT